MIVINSILIEVILNMYLFYNTLIWVQKCFYYIWMYLFCYILFVSGIFKAIR